MADIYNETSNTLITGTAGNDSISNEGDNVNISSRIGNNIISNEGDSVTINSGTGNDTIGNYGDSVVIDVGGGNDYIYNDYADKVTIIGGTGNDTIMLPSSYHPSANTLIKYASGDGNDVIIGLLSSDTIQITASSYTSQQFTKFKQKFSLIETALSILA